MIEFIAIHPWEDYHLRRLPIGVTHYIKSIFRYNNSKERKKSDGNHPNKFSHNRKSKKMEGKRGYEKNY